MSLLNELFSSVGKAKLAFSDWQLAPWKRQWSRIHKFTGAIAVSRSKYKPHQGARECARRVRQGRAGK